ncbi:ROK family transcriptional regulator [Bacillaceae bacterium SIJ1]|uniref:ROK family transcriptional regulator n=1 Tax=Litoribacterium kuwaitense TaxID=1398745 RepID=UPI0013ECFCD3|nr:ROK family transcriptional regulator [Litoribacterium kuwaitense]NGP45943.1 ROK family transcriptional regulator [Litoribacterium kuwaitense]
MRRTGDLKLIQELNRSIILDTIRHYGPISRTEIAKRHQLSPTTVTTAVQELIQEGLVGEGGIGQSSGGRKPKLVQFLPDRHFMIGVAIKKSSLIVSEMNLEANVRRKIHVPVQTNGPKVIEEVIEVLQAFMKHTASLDKCAGIAVITQGVVDASEGVVRHNSKMNLFNVPIKRMFEDAFHLPVYVDNDTNAFILAEKNFNSFDSCKNMLYVTVGDGVGAGIIVNGDIYRGRGGGAGEFGHTSIDRHGELCECGSRGCLENYVSWPAIQTRIFSHITKGATSPMVEAAQGDILKMTLPLFIRSLKDKDPLAVMINDEVAKNLAIGITNLVHLFNPEKVILGGELVYENESLYNQVKVHLEKNTLHPMAKGLKVQMTSLEGNFDMLGAASVLLQDKFNFSL